MSKHVSRAAASSRGLRNRAFGVGFLALVVVLGGLTYAIFNKSFVSYDDVTLRASNIGLQLPSRADVKIRGVRVGEVLGATVRRDGNGVDLRLGLYPAERRTIPENVSARILPKTLFGEKYVALQVPARPSARSIRAGDVISESRVAIEVERVLSDIYPLLRTVQPAQLNYTLTALADALEGRGDRLGSSLVVLDGYLKRMNPKIPLLVDDLGKLATVSDTYAAVVPELATVLRNSVKTGNTFVEKEAKVQALFDDVAGLSSTSKDFLEQNGSNIIRLSRQGQAQLPLFEKYAPEYPCLLQRRRSAPSRSRPEAFRGYTLHINLEPLPRQPRGYTAADQPVYAERGENRIPLGPVPGRHRRRLRPAQPSPRLPGSSPEGRRELPPRQEASRPRAPDVSSGYAGTASERRLVGSLAASTLGCPPTGCPTSRPCSSARWPADPG